VATVDQLAEAQAIIFGTPTRFGNMSPQGKHVAEIATRLFRQP
jgi:multimeric flavodoxin WrbA